MKTVVWLLKLAVAAHLFECLSGSNPSSNTEKSKRLMEEAFALTQANPNSKDQQVKLMKQALELNPLSGNALTQLGTRFMGDPDPKTQNLAHKRLILAFGFTEQTNLVRPKIPVNSPQGFYLASISGRRTVQACEYEKARVLLEAAANSSASVQTGLRTCIRMQLATMLTGYPASIQGAKNEIAGYHKRMDILLGKSRTHFVEGMQRASRFGGSDPDVFCLLTPFYHEIYLEANLRSTMAKMYSLKQRAMPESFVIANWLSAEQDPSQRKRRLRVGVASSFFQPSSVSYDFSGMLSRLSRDRFEFTWISFQERHLADELPFFLQAMKQRQDMKGRPAPERVLVYTKTKADDEEKDAFDRPPWLKRYYTEVSDLELDIILFLDLTMGPMITRAALARVARTQVVSHGHPVTSGSVH